MSKRELRSSGEHRRCGFANGAGERRRGARNSVLCCEDCAQGAGATKTRSRYVSLAAVLSLQERIVCKRLTVTITALLRAKDRRLPSVFVAPAPCAQSALRFLRVSQLSTILSTTPRARKANFLIKHNTGAQLLSVMHLSIFSTILFNILDIFKNLVHSTNSGLPCVPGLSLRSQPLLQLKMEIQMSQTGTTVMQSPPRSCRRFRRKVR